MHKWFTIHSTFFLSREYVDGVRVRQKCTSISSRIRRSRFSRRNYQDYVRKCYSSVTECHSVSVQYLMRKKDRTTFGYSRAIFPNGAKNGWSTTRVMCRQISARIVIVVLGRTREKRVCYYYTRGYEQYGWPEKSARRARDERLAIQMDELFERLSTKMVRPVKWPSVILQVVSYVSMNLLS